MTAGTPVLVVAISARALAAAASRAGYAPLAVDLFADADTRALCAAARLAPGDPMTGFRGDGALAAVAELARAYRPMGIVYGSGFEARPALIAALAAIAPVLGNDAATVARVKDPPGLAAFCAAAGVDHPDVSFDTPRGEGWLLKPLGGGGGLGVAPDDGGAHERCYRQRRVEGASVSALFVADGRRARHLGFSEQWTAPCAAAPFRYGGAAGPATVASALAARMRAAVERAAAHFGLRGLCSADFIVDGDRAWLLEINPRPGATLDVFDSADDPLLRRHVEAWRGRLGAAPAHRGARAAQIVYSTRDWTAPAGLDWPEWAADRPSDGARVGAGEPLCTVAARAADISDARARAARRAAQIISRLQDSRS